MLLFSDVTSRKKWTRRVRRVFRGTGPQAVSLAALFVVGGLLAIGMTLADTFQTATEAESGNVGGAAVACADSQASGGKAVRFGRTGCDETPPTAGQLIGWNDIVDGPGGAWHRFLHLSDGSWLQVLTTFPSPGRSELEIYHSTDHVRSWTKLSGVNDGQRLVDNGFLYSAPNGDILLSGRNLVDGQSYKISQWRSTDKGQSWQREDDLDSASGSNGGLWEPYYFTAGDGRVAAMWSDETHSGYSQVLVEKLSSDNGRTWSSEKVVVQDGSDGRPGMPGVARMANGKYIFVFEVCGTENCDTYYKRSDDGISWPSGIGDRLPGQVCGPFVVSLSDGRVVVTSCRVSDSRQDTPISYSEDFGDTWKTNVPSYTGSGVAGGWPALYQIGPNEIAAIQDGRIRFGNFVPRQ